MKYIEKLAYCAFIGCLLFSQTVFANQVDLAAKVRSCSKISDNETRLGCFDQLTTKLDQKAQQPHTEALKTELTAKQVDSFSKEHVKKTAEELAKEINSITLTVSKVKKTLRGEMIITFLNGQKWQQKDGGRMKLKVGENVTLEKGALGAVYLQKENGNKRIKVKRLK